MIVHTQVNTPPIHRHAIFSSEAEPLSRESTTILDIDIFYNIIHIGVIHSYATLLQMSQTLTLQRIRNSRECINFLSRHLLPFYSPSTSTTMD